MGWGGGWSNLSPGLCPLITLTRLLAFWGLRKLQLSVCSTAHSRPEVGLGTRSPGLSTN